MTEYTLFQVVVPEEEVDHLIRLSQQRQHPCLRELPLTLFLIGLLQGNLKMGLQVGRLFRLCQQSSCR